MKILLYSEKVKFSYKNQDKLINWINNTIIEEKHITKDISIIFTTDSELLKQNKQFLKRDNYTDVIAFDYKIDKEIYGDIYISIERVKENALKFNTTFDNELNRVIIHGVLHFLGYKDYSDYQKKIMKQKENYYLTKF